MPKNLAKEREKGNPCPRGEPFPCFVIISDFLLIRRNSHDGPLKKKEKVIAMMANQLTIIDARYLSHAVVLML